VFHLIAPRKEKKQPCSNTLGRGHQQAGSGLLA
jgi:hypothetical protein